MAFNNATLQTYAGLISGSGGVSVTGPGPLVLGNLANSYSGGTTVTSGTLSIAGNGALAPPRAALRSTAAC